LATILLSIHTRLLERCLGNLLAFEWSGPCFGDGLLLKEQASGTQCRASHLSTIGSVIPPSYATHCDGGNADRPNLGSPFKGPPIADSVINALAVVNFR
jgi:hypothetical protein